MSTVARAEEGPGGLAVHAEGLTKAFKSGGALCGFSLEVPWGEIYGLAGPNGSGKTTALRVLAGLCRPDGGWAEVAGADVVSDVADLRWLVGYVPDHFGVYESMTAAQYLAFYASCYRIAKRRAEQAATDLLALVGLSAKRDEQVDHLSRGMKQRLCLARALVHDPEVLLLDEPASGLDPRARAEMAELVAALGEMGKTVVVASHVLPELAGLCSSVGLVHEGRLVASGPASQLLDEEAYLAATGPGGPQGSAEGEGAGAEST